MSAAGAQPHGRAARKEGRRAWALLALAVSGYAIGAAAYVFDDGAPNRFPSWADAGLFVFYGALTACLVLLIRAEGRWRGPVPWLDSVITGVSAACVAALVLVPSTSDKTNAAAGRLGYALADVFLLAFLLAALSLGGWRRGWRSRHALAAGLALLLAGDVVCAIDAGRGADAAPAFSAIAWAAGLLALAAAPLLSRAAGEPRPERAPPVVVPLVCALVVLPIGLATNGSSMPLVLALACLALALIVVRFALTIAEHSSLTESARADAAFNAALRDSLGEGLLAVGRDGRITMANPAAERLLARPREDLLDARVTLVLPGIDDALHGGGRVSRELDVPLGIGGTLPVLCTVAPFQAAEDRHGHVIVLTDVSTHRLAEEGLLRRAAEHAVVARLGARALEGAGIEELTAEASQALARMLRLPHAAVGEYNAEREEFRLLAGHGLPARARARSPLAPSGAGREAFEASRPVVTADLAGSPDAPPPFLADMQARAALTVPLPGPDHPIGALAAFGPEPRSFSQAEVDFAQSVANVLADAIINMRREERIRHDALHDPLTGLGNRTLLTDRIAHLLSQRRRATVAVLFLDVDRFKQINDSLGHAVGDELLFELAGRLTEAVRPGDTVARLGGDEFIVLCEGLPDPSAARVVAGRVKSAIGEPFNLRGHELVISASIGIAWWDGSDTTPDALMGEADLAMYRAKQAGRAQIALFEPSLRDGAVARLALESDLRRALDGRTHSSSGGSELVVHYQPVVRLSDGEVTSAEALVRWIHPARGLLYPAEFVPLAEESGLIFELGERVLREACRIAAGWRRDIGIGVNISPRQLTDPGLIEVVRDALAESGLEPQRLVLEVTETAVASDIDGSMEMLTELKLLGIRLAIDDFGVGFSSLSRLKRLPPLDVVKIDRSFIAGLPGDDRDRAVVTAAIELGRTLGAEVVGEGVETEEHADALADAHCEFAQGFLFGRPGPDAGLAVAMSGVPDP